MNKINNQKFDELLDLYIDHDASDQDEEQLMKMLDEIADDYMPEGMEQRLESFIEDLDKDEAPAVALEPKTEKGYTLTSYFRKYAAAACAVMVIGIGVAIGNMPSGNNDFTDTCNSPAEAEAQMMRALTMLSYHSQKGIDEARQLMETPVQQQPDYSRFFSLE